MLQMPRRVEPRRCLSVPDVYKRQVYYFRWWLVKRFLGLVHIKWFQGSPIMRFYLRALGAKIGKDTLLGEIEPGAADLISIGAGASIGSNANLSLIHI